MSNLYPSILPEMLESSNLVTFNGLANSSSYDTFLLDEERGRLLVGAEDHIFSFDLVNINRDHKQVRTRSWKRGFWRMSYSWQKFSPSPCALPPLRSITPSFPSPLPSSFPLSVFLQTRLSVIPLPHLDCINRLFYPIWAAIIDTQDWHESPAGCRELQREG